MGEVLQKIEENIFLELNIKDILKKITNKEISPLEISMQCIDRIEEYNEKYKVWICFDKEVLFEQAKKISERLSSGGEIRALEGIPVGIKDIFNTYDFPTQMKSAVAEFYLRK